MSKLYEALENASRERERLETAQAPVIRPFEPPSWKSDLEIMGLYQAIDAALGKKASRVVQFIGTQAGEGCSTIVRDLAAAAAARLEEAVLLIDLDFRNSSDDAATDPTFRYHMETLGAGRRPAIRHSARWSMRISPLARSPRSATLFSPSSTWPATTLHGSG